MTIKYYLLVLVIFLFTTSTALAMKTRLVTRLHGERNIKGSIARFHHLTASEPNDNSDNPGADIVSDMQQLIFSVNISVGEPPQPQLLALDTASSLLWLQCLPCTRCFSQSVPIFDPSKSSTYANMDCSDELCYFHTCDATGLFCVYNYSSGVDSITTTAGNLAFDKLTSVDGYGGPFSISDVVIGFGQDNVYEDGLSSGVFGLNVEHKSPIISRFNYKFSYCLDDISDPDYPFHILILGDKAVFKGASSPLDIFGGAYYVSLEGISMGFETAGRLDIDPKVFQRDIDTGEGGVIIDSGTSFTFLPSAAYLPLSVAVAREIDDVFDRTDNPSDLHCWEGNIKRDIKNFPTVIFNLTGFPGEPVPQLLLDRTSIFYQYADEEFCLAVMENPTPTNRAVIGVLAQQYHNIAYDTIAKNITIYRMDEYDCKYIPGLN